MTKQLYEEALADVRKVKEVAENDAKRAVLEAVTPRIRQFIDQALLREQGLEDDESMMDPMIDIVDADPVAAVPVTNAGAAAAIMPPGADGKITLDIDSMCSEEPGTPVPPPMFGAPLPEPEEAEYEINLESLDALKPVLNASKNNLKNNIAKLSERISLFEQAGKAVRATSQFHEQISQMIARVENMYDYVQDQVSDPKQKSSYETMLEASFKVLNKLQERTTMAKKTNRGQMNEADVTLKLTGLPDDVDLDAMGVDLITGEDDEDGGDDLGGDDAALDDLSLDDEESGDDQDFGGDTQMETRKLSDDTIVEIDEKMLRREISRMRKLRESHTGTGGSETKAQSWGSGPAHFDAFGGGHDEGDPHDQDIVDKSPSPGALPLGEADDMDDEDGEDLDESDDMMDEDDMPEMDEAVDGPQHGGDQTTPTNKQSRHPGESAAVTRQEGLRRLTYEKNLQERAKKRAASLKKEASRARGSKLAEIKSEYASVSTRYNESLQRAKKITKKVAIATQQLKEARSNSVATRSAESTGDSLLRKKLAETNLFNAKLLFTNKILQNEQLTTRQKAQVIKQLDEVKTVREAKLVYESLSSTLAGSSKPVNEGADRRLIGSGSRVTRSATPILNEGYEAERWAQLAGITKR